MQFGVAPRDIEKTTRAILDYSAATGKNAVGAAQQLTSSILSGHGEIRKMGVSIQETGDSTRDLSAATEQLASRFGGSAKGATNNLAGELGRLQKAEEDLSKAFARFFTQSDLGKSIVKGLTEALNTFTYALSDQAAQDEKTSRLAEQYKKVQEELANVERRVGTERQRIAEGSWLASKGSLLAAEEERKAVLQKLSALEGQRLELGHIREAEVARANESAAAATAEASAQAKAEQATERRKRLEEEAAKAAKKAAEEREAMFKRLTAEAKKWVEAQAKASAEYDKSVLAAGANIAERRGAFAEATQGGAARPDTRGFTSFEAALTALQTALEKEAALREQAAMAEVSDEHQLAGRLQVRAEEEKLAAESAGKAADAFKELAKSSAEARQAMEEASKAAVNAMVSKAIGGPIGGLVQAGVQGAQAGAPGGPAGSAAGAAVGVMLELLTESTQFKKLMDIITKVLQSVSDALGQVLEPLLPFYALLEPLATALGAIVAVLEGVLRPQFEVLWAVLKPVVWVVLKVTEVIGSFWNALVGMLQGLLRALGGISIFGGHPLSFLNDWANGLEKSKVNVKGIDDALAKLNGATYDNVAAQEDQTDSQKKLTDATEKATASMTNVPTGYKVALARFQAANGDALRTAGGTGSPVPTGGGGAAAGIGGGSSGGGFGGGPGGGTGRSQNLVQVFIDGDEVLQRLQVRQSAQTQRQAGRRSPVIPRLLGAF